jgi:hypothetical protein
LTPPSLWRSNCRSLVGRSPWERNERRTIWFAARCNRIAQFVIPRIYDDRNGVGLIKVLEFARLEP